MAVSSLTSAQVALVVGAVASGALESADMGVVWRPSTATFSLTRFLPDAPAGRRSACTGFGANSAAENTRPSECTEMVCCCYPLRVKVTESSATSRVSSHGVRQVCPETLTWAPGRTDSNRNAVFAGDDLRKSRLGIDAEHAANVKPHTTKPMTRLITYSYLACTSPTHRKRWAIFPSPANGVKSPPALWRLNDKKEAPSRRARV